MQLIHLISFRSAATPSSTGKFSINPNCSLLTHASHSPRYERLSWIPVPIVYLVALGLGGSNLSDPPPPEPASARHVLTYAAVLAGFIITFSPMGCDFTTYMDPKVSRLVNRLF